MIRLDSVLQSLKQQSKEVSEEPDVRGMPCVACSWLEKVAASHIEAAKSWRVLPSCEALASFLTAV
jgi:hypothetical protein